MCVVGKGSEVREEGCGESVRDSVGDSRQDDDDGPSGFAQLQWEDPEDWR